MAERLCVRLQSESIGVRIPSSPNLHLPFLPSTGAVYSNSGTGQSGRICESTLNFESLRVSFEDATIYYRYRLETINWDEYFEWLKNSKGNLKYAKIMLSYAKKYGDLGFNYKLVIFPESRKKQDILKAIANLCHFIDILYDTILHTKFTQWIKQKGLKWTSNYRSHNYEVAKKIIPEKIIQNIHSIDHKVGVFAKFVLVTGLRTEEALKAFNEHDKYCNGQVMELFWDRKTKKANAVFCHPELHKQINFKLKRGMVNRRLHSKKLGCQIRDLRKINYTLVATEVNEPLAKFMQGRTGDISQRLYYLPMMNGHHKKWQEIWDEVVFTN